MLSEFEHTWTRSISVAAGYSLELCLVKVWSSADPLPVTIEVEFFGFKSPSPIRLVSAIFEPNLQSNVNYTNNVTITNSMLTPVEISPSFTFDILVVPHRPVDSRLEPLGPLDLTSDGQQYLRLLLSYKINSKHVDTRRQLAVSKTTEASFEVAGVTDFLYENPYDCVLIQVFKKSKQYVHGCSSFHKRV